MGKGNTGVSQSVQQGELSNENALVALAQQQQSNSQTLFNLGLPGLEQAENFYGSLSTGDPGKIAAAIAPATQQVNAATASAKQNIIQNSPAGGEKNLALEQADVAQGAQIGQLASGAYTGSFNALASLGGQNIGQSTSLANTSISGLSSANSALGQLGSQQLQSQAIQAQEKGSTLGALGSLGGGLLEGAGSAGGFGQLFNLIQQSS